MQVRIQVGGGTDDAQDMASLKDWFDHDPKLRGLVKPESSPPPPGKMGFPVDALIALLGNGEAIAAMAASVTTWLLTRRSQVRVKVTGEQGHSVELDIRSTNAEKLLRSVLDGPDRAAGDDGAAT